MRGKEVSTDTKEDPYNLKQEIRNLGMTQKGFAKHTGMSEDAVGKWVRGEIDMPKWVPLVIRLLHKEYAYDRAKEYFCGEKV